MVFIGLGGALLVMLHGAVLTAFVPAYSFIVVFIVIITFKPNMANFRPALPSFTRISAFIVFLVLLVNLSNETILRSRQPTR